MVIAEVFSFIIISVLSIISLSGLGKMINASLSKNFFNNFFYGFIIVAFLVTIIHFFVKINIYISLIIFLTGLLLNFKNLILSKIKINKDYITYFIIIMIFVPMYISQKYHEDFGYYHLPYIINLINEKIIFGLANINRAFVHNSLWLNVLPVFYLKDNYNFVTLPTFLVYVVFIIFSINQITKSKDQKISNFFLIVTIFYLILKFTRITEFGNDIPAVIFSSLAIYNFFRFLEEEDKEKKNDYFFNNLSFAVFAILIKFSSIPIILLSIYLFLKNHKILINNIFKIHFILIYFLCFMFFLQQFVYTGCFIFPSKISCFDVSWFDQNFLNSKYRLELINKGYFATAKDILSEEEYLKNFTWLSFWFERNYIGMTEHLSTMIAPVIIFLILLKKKVSLNFSHDNKLNFFYFFVLIGFLFWIEFSPVYRFGIIYFLSLVFLLSFFIYRNKIFSKKIFLILISIFLFFNFTKNIVRLSNEKEIFVGIKKIYNTSIPNSYYKNNSVKVFQPDMRANAEKGNGWQGRLCWDIEFICTKNKVIIEKKNNYLFIKIFEE